MHEGGVMKSIWGLALSVRARVSKESLEGPLIFWKCWYNVVANRNSSCDEMSPLEPRRQTIYASEAVARGGSLGEAQRIMNKSQILSLWFVCTVADSWHKKKAWGCISLQCASAVLKPSGQPTHYSDWQFTPSALPDIYNRQRISVEILQWKGKRRVWSVPGMSLILLRNHQSGSCVPDLWETLLYIHIHTYIKTVS